MQSERKTVESTTLRDARQSIGLTVDELAKRSGIHFTTIHRLEKKSAWPTHYLQRRNLLNVLGVADV